jgi:hypothetical protein
MPSTRRAPPRLADAELQELADDIKLGGLLHPVVVFRGQILDGRNRLAACEMAGVAPRFTEWAGGGSPVEWVISTNVHRRHLTASQRAVVALDSWLLFEPGIPYSLGCRVLSLSRVLPSTIASVGARIDRKLASRPMLPERLWRLRHRHGSIRSRGP